MFIQRKVFIPKPSEDWILDRIINEFCSKTSHQIVDNIEKSDVVFLYARYIWNHFPIQSLIDKKVIMTWHHIVPEKFNKQEFDFCNNFVDLYHVPNIHTESFIKNLTTKPIKRLCYWIDDRRFFYDSELKNLEALKKIILPDNKNIILSAQRDTEGNNLKDGIIKPKLEKGPDILFKILSKLPKEKYCILLSGYRRDWIINQIKTIKFDYFYIERFEDINALYNLCDYVLITSRFEGSPQQILESAQTRTKILSTDVGTASEILHKDCLCNSVDEFVEKMEKNNFEHIIDFNYKNIQNYTIDRMVLKYDKMISNV